MRQSAALLVADACVGVVRTLVDVSLITLGALLAVTQMREPPTHRRARRHLNVGVATFGVRAAPAQKMHTSRGSVGRRFMGEIATYTCVAMASLQEVLADGYLVGVVDVGTRRSFVAGT